MKKVFSAFSKINPLTVAIFISGRGSNMQKIVENVEKGYLDKVAIHSIYCDDANAPGLVFAEKHGISIRLINPADKKHTLPPEEEKCFVQELQNKVQLICLAGFMRLFKHHMLDAFAGHIINIHPSLLPRHPGLNAQQKAIDAGDKESGCTVHLVDKGIDTGAVLAQTKVKIQRGDSATSLSERILFEEHKLYSLVIKNISEGKLSIPLS